MVKIHLLNQAAIGYLRECQDLRQISERMKYFRLTLEESFVSLSEFYALQTLLSLKKRRVKYKRFQV